MNEHFKGHIVELLGEGAFGSTYMVSRNDGKKYAVKIINDSKLARKEIDALKEIENLQRIKGIVAEDAFKKTGLIDEKKDSRRIWETLCQTGVLQDGRLNITPADIKANVYDFLNPENGYDCPQSELADIQDHVIDILKQSLSTTKNLRTTLLEKLTAIKNTLENT